MQFIQQNPGLRQSESQTELLKQKLNLCRADKFTHPLQFGCLLIIEAPIPMFLIDSDF